MKAIKVLFTGYLLFFVLFGGVAAAQPDDTNNNINIALGKKAIFNTNPNYALSTDPEDEIQLTDGKYSSEGNLQEVQNTRAIWVQKGTVGWQNKSPITITFDLGKTQPISGVSYSTAAGRASVLWPSIIFVAVSEDNKIWNIVGDLVQLSAKNATPPQEGYANFRYITHDLRVKGRYISFVVVQSPYIFVDEIEVYKGDDAWLAQSMPEATVSDLSEYVARNQEIIYARRRINNDIASIRELVEKSSVSAAHKSTFMAQLDKSVRETVQMNTLPPNFKAILPINNTHRDVLATYGKLRATEGQRPFLIWKQHRYAWLPLFAEPSAQEKVRLEFSMLHNQTRSDSLLITNSTGKLRRMTLKIQNPPQGAAANWLRVYSVEWTDTAQGRPVADALVPANMRGRTYQIDIPAGMTRKIWLTVDSSKIPAGSYKSTFIVDNAPIPMNVDISSVAMSKPRMSLGMWDYMNGAGNRAITPQNRAAALRLMRSHHVDSLWATRDVLPWPQEEDFNSKDVLKGALDFSALDEWMKLWTDARHYFVYGSVGETFAGAEIGTTEFNIRVGSWAEAITAHLTRRGINPRKLGILLVDEPKTDKQDAIISAWAKAINAAAPKLTIFQDPAWVNPEESKHQEAFTEADILVPNLPRYRQDDSRVAAFYQQLRQQGKDLWLYQAAGPVRLFSPQEYYRYQAWHVFSIGGTGQGFWAFGDISGAPSSWNEYPTTRDTYAPAFIDKSTIYSSIHWDAVREGVEDFETLSMLRDKINTSKDATWKSNAQKILNAAVAAVTDSWQNDYDWRKTANNDVPDQQLLKVRKLLEDN